jgi:hypothetical protein
MLKRISLKNLLILSIALLPSMGFSAGLQGNAKNQQMSGDLCADKLRVVELSDGTRLSTGLVVAIGFTLEDLFESDFEVFKELVQKANQPDFQMSETAKQKLIDYRLLEFNGRLREDIRKVILSFEKSNQY